MNIDAKDSIIGRIAVIAAKKVLLGENVNIFNVEQAIVTGGRFILEKYDARVKRGTDAVHGPFFPKTPTGIMRRTVRGMLPYGQPRGREAYKKIRCYLRIPDKFKDAKLEAIEKANLKKLPKYNFWTLKDLCRELGWKK